MSKSNFGIDNFTSLTTFVHTCDDTAEELTDVTGYYNQFTVYAGTLQETKSNVVRVTITCEDHDIRFAFNLVPTQAGLGHVLTAGSSVVISGHKNVSNFNFINKTNGADAVLQITPELSV